jgi:hypothetical protein
MDQRGLCAAFDLLNFSPDDAPDAILQLDTLTIHLIDNSLIP